MLLLALPIACKKGEVAPPIGEEVPDEPALIALDAFRDGDKYYVRYRRASEVFYAAGRLRSQVPGVAAPSGSAYDQPLVVPMKQADADPWTRFTHSMIRIPILGIEDWTALRNNLFKEFMPTDGSSGVAVSFDRGDYFFFYDRTNTFRARRLIDKPPWYSVSARIDLKQYFDRWQPVLQRFLRERGINANEVIFNTGDLDKGAFPFIYVNTLRKLIVLVRYDELPPSMREDVPGLHVLQSAWHFIESHTYTVAMRPFSSLSALISLAADTAVESGRKLLGELPQEAPIPPLATRPPMDLQRWERELDERLGRPASRGTLTFLVDGEAFFTRFVDAVTSAEDSVDVRAYIFDNDDVALTVGELLKRRSREGINVRVLFDGLGSIIASGEQSRTEPRDHRPPVWIGSYLKDDSNVEVREVKNVFFTGDHVKTMIIDKQIAFLGGMNIGREYRHDWHDLMVEVTGPVVDEINDEFDLAWGKAGWMGDFSALFDFGRSKRNRHSEGHPLRLIYTKPGQYEIYDLQRKAISRAQSYVYIENAYFTDDVLLKELILARRRGVDVRVIIPLETDRGIITRNIALAANIMLKNGIRVYIYPGFTHAKAAIFDGWASVGTANLDRLSLKINREINIATSHPAAVQSLRENLFEKDFAYCTELEAPFPERWTDHLIEMFGDYVF